MILCYVMCVCIFGSKQVTNPILWHNCWSPAARSCQPIVPPQRANTIIKYYQMIVCFVLVRVGPSYSGEFGRPAVLSMCIHFHPLMQTWRSWNPHFTVPESLRNLFEFRASWFALPCFKQPAVRHQELYMPGHFCHHVEWRSSYTSSVINIHPHGCQCQTLSNPQSAINAWFLE